MKKKIAVITGANRGMGYAASEKLASLDYHVIMVGRTEAEINLKAHQLLQKKLSVEAFVADISNKLDTDKLVDHIYKTYGHVDVLINNAGIYIEEGSAISSQDKVMQTTFEVNTMGPYRLMKKIIPIMLKNGYGRVVNVSSSLGSFQGASANCPSYSLSKSSLNMLTILFAQEVKGTNVKVNSIDPGWVQTDMGGSSAPRSVEQGTAGMIWAATLDDKGPSGGFFCDGKAVSW